MKVRVINCSPDTLEAKLQQFYDDISNEALVPIIHNILQSSHSSYYNDGWYAETVVTIIYETRRK